MRQSVCNVIKAVTSTTVAGVIACGCGVLLACASDNAVKTTGEKSITSVATTGFDHYYADVGEVDIDSLAVAVTYSDGTTKTLTEKLVDVDVDAGDAEAVPAEEAGKDFATETVPAVETDSEEDESGETTETVEEITEEETVSVFDGGAEFVLYTDGLYEELMLGHDAEGVYMFSCLLAEDMKTYDLGTVCVGGDITYFNVTLFEEPEFVTEYKANLERCGDKDDDNDFVGTAEEYCVGDDNAFVFVPKLTLSDPNSKKLSFTQSVFDVDVEVYLEGDEIKEPLNLDDNLYVEYGNFDLAVSRILCKLPHNFFVKDEILGWGLPREIELIANVTSSLGRHISKKSFDYGLNYAIMPMRDGG